MDDALSGHSVAFHIGLPDQHEIAEGDTIVVERKGKPNTRIRVTHVTTFRLFNDLWIDRQEITGRIEE
jgi:hypothetical protein